MKKSYILRLYNCDVFFKKYTNNFSWWDKNLDNALYTMQYNYIKEKILHCYYVWQ